MFAIPTIIFPLDAVVWIHAGVFETQRKGKACWKLSKGNYEQTKTIFGKYICLARWTVNVGDKSKTG